VINLYGPTEAAIVTSSFIYEDKARPDYGLVPIGTPFDSFIYRVDAPHSNEAGELWISGPQLCGGYWKNEPATQKAFQEFDDGRGLRRWYKTGDLVRRDEHGNLHFLGRIDHQIKLRGFRVEALEVELAVRKATNADFAAVVPKYSADGLCQDLIAFINILVNESDAKKMCLRYVPSYMVPSRIHYIADFPVTPNGKIDYTALADRVDDDGSLRNRPAVESGEKR